MRGVLFPIELSFETNPDLYYSTGVEALFFCQVYLMPLDIKSVISDSGRLSILDLFLCLFLGFLVLRDIFFFRSILEGLRLSFLQVTIYVIRI